MSLFKAAKILDMEGNRAEDEPQSRLLGPFPLVIDIREPGRYSMRRQGGTTIQAVAGVLRRFERVILGLVDVWVVRAQSTNFRWTIKRDGASD